MIMKGKEYKGFCYVHPTSLKTKKDVDYWVNLCLDYNEKPKPSKKKK